MKIHQLTYVGHDRHSGHKINVKEGDELYDPKRMLDRTKNYYLIYSIKKTNDEIISLDDWTNKGFVESFEDYGNIIVTKHGKYNYDIVERRDLTYCAKCQEPI